MVKITGNGENAHIEHFLLFPTCFLSFLTQVALFEYSFTYCFQLLAVWTCLQFCHVVNPLPDDKILDCSKLKQIADNILNGKKKYHIG